MAVASQARAADFEIAPPGRWVAPLPVEAGEISPDEGAAGDVEYLLIDAQVHVAGSVEHHRHVAMRVRTPSGVERAAELRVDFDPAYQRLLLHGAWVLRSGRRISALRAQLVRVIQREADLDRRLFDGTRTAVLYLPDVRVGDVVEYSYTIVGENPVLGAHFAEVVPLAYGVPVNRLRQRVLWGYAEPLHHRTRGIELPSTERALGEEQEYVWERRRVAGVDEEDRLPPGVTPWPELELTDFGSWGEVVRWALPFYGSAPLSAPMRAQVATWRRFPTAAARAQAALRFVQDEIRYLGIELGERSHRPHPPADVFARRFGDCKDKSFLLVTLLRAMGMEASPALVDTEEQAAAADRLPSPFAFDHVIVRASIDGRTRWLEPTRSYEHAPIDALVPPTYERALVIQPGEDRFEALPAAAPSAASASLNYRVQSYGAPVAMEVVTTVEGLRALHLRAWIANDGLREVQRSYLQHYSHGFPGIRSEGLLVIEDDPEADRVVVHERYALPPVTAGTEQEFVADLVEPELESPQSVARRLPLRVPHPVVLREDIRIDLPGRPTGGPDHQAVATSGARFERGIEILGRTIHAHFEYCSLTSAVAPTDVERHTRGLREMRELSAFTAPLSIVVARRPAPRGAGSGVRLPFLSLVLVAGLVVLLAAARSQNWLMEFRQWRRRRSFATRFLAQPGDSPSEPLLASSEADIPRMLDRMRCSCGGRLAGTPIQRSEVLFDGHVVVAVLVPCGRCPERRRVYLRLRDR